MATRYAVASGAWSSTTSVWSDTAGGSPGSFVPVNNDTVVINANVSVLMDVDQSGFADGIAGMTITSHATTPGMLYFKDGTNGYLKIKTGTTIAGTNLAAKGRILANSDGTWGGTTELAATNTAVIALAGTATITGNYLELRLYCSEPTTKMVRTYGTLRSGVTVDAGTDTFTYNSHGFANATVVMFRSSGTLPAPLEADIGYYIVSTATNTFKVAYWAGGTAVDITSTGSGTLDVYSGHPASPATATINVLDDVTGETNHWKTSGLNRVILANSTTGYDGQKLTLVTINAGTIVLSANVDSAQGPNSYIVLMSRNVSIQSGMTGNNSVVSALNGSVLNCEFHVTNAALSSYGYSALVNCTVGGTIGWCVIGSNAATGTTFSGVIIACTTGVSSATNPTITGTIGGCYSGVGGSGGTFSGTAFGTSYTFSGWHYATMTGGKMLGCTVGFSNSYYCVVSGGRFNIVSYLCNGCTCSSVTGGDFHGTAYLFSGEVGGVISTDVVGVSTVFYKSQADCTSSAIKDGYVVSQQSTVVFHSTAFSTISAYVGIWFSTVTGYNTTWDGGGLGFIWTVTTALTDDFNRCYRFFDYGGTAGDIRAWNGGGTITTEAYNAGTHGTPPVTLALVYKNTFTTAYQNGIDIPLMGRKNVPTRIKVYMKKSVNGMLTTPYVKLCDPNKGFEQTGETLATATMADDTNWQTLVVEYTPTYDRQLILRIAGKNASGILYWNWEQASSASWGNTLLGG